MESFVAVYPHEGLDDQLATLRNDYELMRSYWQQGYQDEQLSVLYQRLLQRMYALYGNTSIRQSIRQSAFLMTAHDRVRRYPYMRDWSIAAVRHEMENFVSDVTLLELEPANKQPARKADLYGQHQQMMNDVFDYVWTSGIWTESEAQEAEELLLSPTVDSNDQQLILTAVTLSAMNCFDMAKFRLLVHVYQQAQDEQVRQRALVGWVLSISPIAGHIYPEQQQMINKLLNDKGCLQELTELQIQLIYCINAERDQQKIHQEIMPDLLKNNTFRITRNGIEEVEEDPMDDVLHPEESERRMEKLESSFRKMMDMQKQGSDIYFAGFSQMKRFPFFHTMSNWFVPFYMEHPQVVEALASLKNGQIVAQMLRKAPFCNSDKYSFVFAIQQVLDRLPVNLREMLLNGEATIDEMTAEEMASPAFMRRIYLQDLYRFFRIFPNANWFVNPFDTRQDDLGHCLFFILPTFKGTKLEQYYNKVASLLLKQHMPEQSAKLLAAHTSPYFDYQYYMMAGDILLQNPDCQVHESAALTAVECYQKALEHDQTSERAWQGYARALFAASRYEDALSAYDQLLVLNPDKRNYLLNKAVCLTNLSDYAEAQKILFRLNYDAPDDANVNRVLAWALTGEGKYEQAMRLYEKLTSAEAPVADDILNEGYCLWLMRRIDAAAERFRHFLQLSELQPQYIYSNEKALLDSKGISEPEVQMMLDLIS